MQTRRRFKQTASLQDRIAEWAANVRKEAASMPPGPDRDALTKKLEQAERAMHVEAWANSSGLRPPE
jgi:hypothetical protein